MRECYSCGSIKTYVRKDGQQQWYRNRPFEQWFCENCNNRFVKHPKWNPIQNKKWNPIWNPINNAKCIWFVDRKISFNESLRTGYCSWCPNNIYDKSCKRTHIHHTKYHNDDPLKDTIELCASCHTKESWRLRH